MSNSAGTLIIARFPPEIRDVISALLDKKDLDSLTKVSKLYRSLFAPCLFKEVRVEDTGRNVARLLEAVPSSPRTSQQLVNVWAYVTHPTITLPPGGRPRSPFTWRKATDRYTPADEATPKQIIRCIELMTSLRVLSIDVEPLSVDQEHMFLRLLRAAAAWEVTHLRVAAPPLLTGCIIGNCSPETLLSLQVTNGQGPRDDTRMNERASRLKRLHVSESAYCDTVGSPFPRVHSIARRFPSLEWLVIHTRHSDYTIWLIALEEKIEFEKKFGLFAQSLKAAFPKLKRFGMLIPSLSYRPSSAGPLTTYRPASWYFELIGEMGRIMPNVHEVCIMGMYPHLYRGTRAEDGVEMGFQYEKVQQADRFKFPIGLVY